MRKIKFLFVNFTIDILGILRIIGGMMREEKITQAEMARILGLSPSFVCDLKKGRRRLGKDLAFKFAKRFNLPYEKLSLMAGEPLYQMLCHAIRHRSYGIPPRHSQSLKELKKEGGI